MNTLRLLFALLLGMGTMFESAAQSYPTRAVRIVVPFAAGGATDAITRSLGQKLSETLGQAVVIDNRPGAAGGLAAALVAKAAPDGYTLLMATTSTHAVLPILKPSLGYEPIRDFSLVSLVAWAPNLLIVSPKVPAKDVAELIAYAKANPGKLNFASSGTGTITHLISEMFVSMANIQATHVPYKTGVQAVPDVISGQIAFLFDSIVWSLPQIRAGTLKGLAIASPNRSSLAPEIPTVSESGLPGFEGVTWVGLVGPAGIPRDAVTRLAKEVRATLQSAEMKQRLAAQGAEAAGSSPEEFAAQIRRDMDKWGQVIRKAGVKVDG